jgi:hypothetical protein
MLGCQKRPLMLPLLHHRGIPRLGHGLELLVVVLVRGELVLFLVDILVNPPEDGCGDSTDDGWTGEDPIS